MDRGAETRRITYNLQASELFGNFYDSYSSILDFYIVFFLGFRQIFSWIPS